MPGGTHGSGAQAGRKKGATTTATGACPGGHGPGQHLGAARPTEARTFFDVSFQRSYRDAHGHLQNTQSFDLNGLLVLQHAVGCQAVPMMLTTSSDGKAGGPFGPPLSPDRFDFECPDAPILADDRD
ncbi:MAG: hypothetical protein WA324_10910 [Bryobacteraceae bacterium]